MTERFLSIRAAILRVLQLIWSMVNEREEVYFAALVTILTVALGFERLTGTEFIAGVVTLYGLLIAGGGARAFADRKGAEDV